MNRQRRIIQFFYWKIEALSDWVLDQPWWEKVPDPIFPTNTWLRPFCDAMRAHYVIDDQCNKPEHRYCVWCARRTPGWEVTRSGR